MTPLRKPSFWPNGESTTCIQVHTAADADALKKAFQQSLRRADMFWSECRRIAFSVTGERLEVFQIRRALPWMRNWLFANLPKAAEVYGGEWTDFWKREERREEILSQKG